MIILASSSPRRIELLKTLYDDFKIIKPTFDESLISKNDKDLALKESYEKGKSILNTELIFVSYEESSLFKCFFSCSKNNFSL